MIKEYQLAVLLLLLNFVSKGQNKYDSLALTRRATFSNFELLVGPSSVSQNGYQKYQWSSVNKAGLVINGSLTYPISKHFEIAGMILWERKGAKRSRTGIGTAYTSYGFIPSSGPTAEQNIYQQFRLNLFNNQSYSTSPCWKEKSFPNRDWAILQFPEK